MLSSGLSTIPGNSRGTDSIQSGGDKKKVAHKDPNKQHREKHPGRYSNDAKNPAVQTSAQNGTAAASIHAIGMR